MFFFDFFSRENTERQVVFFLCSFPWQTCLRLCSPLFLRCLGMISLRRAHCIKKKDFFQKTGRIFTAIVFVPFFVFEMFRIEGFRAGALCKKKEKVKKQVEGDRYSPRDWLWSDLIDTAPRESRLGRHGKKIKIKKSKHRSELIDTAPGEGRLGRNGNVSLAHRVRGPGKKVLKKLTCVIILVSSLVCI